MQPHTRTHSGNKQITSKSIHSTLLLTTRQYSFFAEVLSRYVLPQKDILGWPRVVFLQDTHRDLQSALTVSLSCYLLWTQPPESTIVILPCICFVLAEAFLSVVVYFWINFANLNTTTTPPVLLVLCDFASASLGRCGVADACWVLGNFGASDSRVCDHLRFQALSQFVYCYCCS